MQAQRGQLHKIYWHCGITEWDPSVNDWRENGLVKQLAEHYPLLFKIPSSPESRLEVYNNLKDKNWSDVDAWKYFGSKVKNLYHELFQSLFPVPEMQFLNQFKNCSLA